MDSIWGMPFIRHSHMCLHPAQPVASPCVQLTHVLGQDGPMPAAKACVDHQRTAMHKARCSITWRFWISVSRAGRASRQALTSASSLASRELACSRRRCRVFESACRATTLNPIFYIPYALSHLALLSLLVSYQDLPLSSFQSLLAIWGPKGCSF